MTSLGWNQSRMVGLSKGCKGSFISFADVKKVKEVKRLIVEYVATRHGGDRLLGMPEFSQLVSALNDLKVRSLKERSECHGVLCDLMRSGGWMPQIQLGGSKGRQVDFYKPKVHGVVEVIASTPVWIAPTMARLANISNGIRGLYLVLSLDEMKCSFRSVLAEVDNVSRVLVRNVPLLVLACRSPV